MSIENATVKPNVIGAFVKVDAQTLALTQEVLNHAHGLIQKVAGTRENTRQIRILEIFKGLTQRLSNPEMENAKSIPDVVRWLFQQELYASMLTNAGYTESSVDALLRRLVEMKFLIIRGDEYGPGDGISYLRISGHGMAYLVVQGGAVVPELNNFLITGSARGMSDMTSPLPANAYLTDFVIDHDDPMRLPMSGQMVKRRFQAEQVSYHLLYDEKECLKLMEHVVARDAKAVWPLIADKWAFCKTWVDRWVDVKLAAQAFLNHEVLHELQDAEVLNTLASIAFTQVSEDDAWRLLEEEVCRVGWMALRTAVDNQTGLGEAKHLQQGRGRYNDPEFTYDGTKVLAQPAGGRGDMVVTFNDGEALTIEVKGRSKGDVPANLAMHVGWVREALEMYENPEAFYDQMSEAYAEAEAADWAAEQMVDQAKGS